MNIANTEASPVPVNVVNSAVSEPMQHDLVSGAFIVPTDRLLIIKYVSGNCYMTEGFHILKFFIGTGPAENRMTNHFVPVFIGNWGGDDYFSFSQQTYIYAPSGSTVNYGWGTSNPSTSRSRPCYFRRSRPNTVALIMRRKVLNSF